MIQSSGLLHNVKKGLEDALHFVLKYQDRWMAFRKNKPSVVMDYKKYCKDNNIDKIVDSLYNKGVNVADRLPKESYQIVTNNFRVIEFFSTVNDIPADVLEMFKDEHKMVAALPNIESAFYMYVGPWSQVSEHLDDQNYGHYRIITGVYGTENTTFTNIKRKDTRVLTKYESIGIDIEVELHKGKNNADSVQTMFIISLDKEKYRE